jgi:hypothetical protein
MELLSEGPTKFMSLSVGCGSVVTYALFTLGAEINSVDIAVRMRTEVSKERG